MFISFLTALAELRGGTLYAQEPPVQDPPAPDTQPSTAPVLERPTADPAQTCVQPAPMVQISDYQGPLAKIVGEFARPLERKSVHPSRYRPGLRLCTLSVKDKFVLFVQDSIDPVEFLGAAFNAGLDQAQDSDPSYGQGAQGYGRRFGAELAGDTASRFLKDFAYPSIFKEDPRYYRLGGGKTSKRFLHAFEHAVVAHRDNGTLMFNFSEWLGTSSVVALNNTYHPDYRRGFGPAAERVSYNILQDVGFDMLREFWPEISRKFKLPFRGESEPVASQQAP